MSDLVNPPSHPRIDIRRATFYFALVYFSQGISQISTLLNQPLRMYLQRSAGMDASGISRFWFVATLPWMIKPVYGLLSDFFPILGYRRKSYLLLLNLLAAGAFLLVTRVYSTGELLVMLTLTAVGVGGSDVVVDAMMVQAGQQTGRTRLFQGAQWFSLNVAAIFSGLLGSAICDRLRHDPAAALQTAALIAMCVPFIVATLTWFLVDDQRASLNVAEFKATAKALLGAFASLRLWLVVLFLFLAHFNPGVQTAMYGHLQARVGLSHAYLAMLDTFRHCGNVVGALVFMLLMSGRMPTKTATTIGLVVGAAGLLPLLAITGKTSVAVAYGVWGVCYMIVSLSQLTVAAEACPRRVEAVVFAALMSVSNLSTNSSDLLGSRLYDGLLHQNIRPLILLSAGLTAAGLLFVPVLKPVQPSHMSR
jgi:hypothetical protein